MRFDIVKLVALLGLCVMVSWSWKSDFTSYDPAEAEASLFDNETFRYVHSKVELTGSSLNVQPTVHKWTKADGVQVDAAGKVKTVAALISFSSTAYADEEPPTSTQEGVCSTDSGGPSTGPAGCSTEGSTGTEDIAACSTANDTGGPTPGFGTKCSTKDAGGPNGSKTCSASGSEGGNDFTSCSAGGATSQCSAGGTTDTVGCSTAGGSSGDGREGAVGCSATGVGGTGKSCSTTGNTSTVTCSTYEGEHQQCSASNATAPGEGATKCSASGGEGGEGGSSMCSVNAPMEGGDANTDPNQCSANTQDPAQGTAQCSAFGQGSGTCSVSSTDASKNAQCTAIPSTQPGGGNNPNYQCSAFEGAPASSCSVIGGNGNGQGPVPAGNQGLCPAAQ